jgi:hypothetical protein
MPVRARQGALPRLEEELAAAPHPVCAVQSVDDASNTIEGTAGMSAPEIRRCARGWGKNTRCGGEKRRAIASNEIGLFNRRVGGGSADLPSVVSAALVTRTTWCANTAMPPNNAGFVPLRVNMDSASRCAPTCAHLRHRSGMVGTTPKPIKQGSFGSPRSVQYLDSCG